MANEAYELAVRLLPDGIDETSEGLEDVEEQFEETAGAAKEQTESTVELSREWQGAMGVIVSALTVASAGLLSQVPVLGDLFAGLFSIVESVAIQMDEFLRPVLGPIADAMFRVSNAIAEAEGPWGTLIGLLGTVVAILGAVVAPILAIAAHFFGLSAVLGFLAGAFSTVVGIVGTVLGVLAGLVSLPALIIAAIAVLVAVLLTDFMGLRTKAIEIISGLVSGAIELFGNLLQGALGLGQDLLTGLVGVLLKLRAAWKTGWETLWAVVVSLAKAGANQILGTIESLVNRAVNALNRLPHVNLSTVSLPRFNRQGLGQIAQQASARLNARLQGADRQTNAFANRQLQPIVLEIEGRPVAEVVADIQTGEVRSSGRET